MLHPAHARYRHCIRNELAFQRARRGSSHGGKHCRQTRFDAVGLAGGVLQNRRLSERLRFMRDPTRGGLATVAHETAAETKCDVRLIETATPVRDAVRSVCHMLGYDPYYYYIASEVILQVKVVCLVILETELGGERLLDELEDDPLPRICWSAVYADP